MTAELSHWSRRVLLFCSASCLAATSQPVGAQDTTSVRGTVHVLVSHDSLPVPDVTVHAGRMGALTDETGSAALRLSPGSYTVGVRKLGFRPETVAVMVSPGLDTLVRVALVEQAATVAPITITSTRTERRLEDEPLRVEVLSGEDISEKNEMRPGDLRNLVREMSGVRVQTTTPTLGGAALRIQGMPGRYALLLNDGLPLYGTQSGGFGLAQIPPLDLRQAEVIKGASSALYGPSALSGVLNLVSRRPPDTSQVLVNQTARGGTDALAYAAPRLSRTLSLTVLGGLHGQRVADADHDGWSDIAGLRRAELRPRLFYDDSTGHSFMLTVGGFAEDRAGGSVDGSTSSPGGTLLDSLTTRHADLGGIAHWQLGEHLAVAMRACASTSNRRRLITGTAEDERQRTIFGEVTATHVALANIFVAGLAWQRDGYRNAAAMQFDQTVKTPAAFVQETLTPTGWFAATVNARCDASSTYGTICTPRVSLLVHHGSAVSARVSAGAGWFAPMALNEETEAIGLSHVVLPQPLIAERARTTSIDVTATRGALQVNGTLFSNRVASPLGLRPFLTASGDSTTPVALVNAPGTLRTWGGELFSVFNMEPIIATAYLASTRSRELSPATGAPREVPLTPREEAGLDLAYEEDETGSYLAAELFYTGRQPLEDDPYRRFGRPYTTVGLLAAKRIRRATLFLNLENLTDIRLSRYEPVRRSRPGEGGTWTVDAWAPLEGRSVNAGVRYAL